MKRTTWNLILAAAALAATVAQAQPSGQAAAPAAGRLLVATPQLPDPNFSESVLLLLHHDDDGTLAVMINRPTWVEAAGAFPALPALEAYEDELYWGGPIAPTQLLMLIDAAAAPPDSTHIIGDVYLSTNLDLLRDDTPAGGGRQRIRVFAGHATWAPEQLAAEIAAGQWRVLPRGATNAFTAEPLALWERLQDSDAIATADELTAGRAGP